MNNLDDATIIERIKNGEIDEFSVLTKKYAGKIQTYVNGKLFDKNDVDDLVQNSFLHFYQALGRFDLSKPVLPYLYQIARNEVLMYYRSKKQTVSLDEALHVADETTGDEHHDAESLLESLTDEQKNALQWVYEGYSYEEIANKLNKPLNTVRTIIRRARLKIIEKHENNRG